MKVTYSTKEVSDSRGSSPAATKAAPSPSTCGVPDAGQRGAGRGGGRGDGRRGGGLSHLKGAPTASVDLSARAHTQLPVGRTVTISDPHVAAERSGAAQGDRPFGDRPFGP